MNNKSIETAKKNNRKSKQIILVSAISLLVVVCVIAAAVLQKSPKEKVTENMNSLLLQEKEQLDPESVGTKIAEAIYSNVSFEVMSANRETAKIVIHSPDIYSVYMAEVQRKGDVVPQTASEYEQLVSSLLDSVYAKLKDGDYKMKTTETVVQLNDEHEIELSYEFVDALYGGLLSLQDESVNSYIGGDDK